ncbi:MAG: S1/P1 nuclease [Gammaproteobacteria bacterium]|nr:S1/P1 nuclease [Gammaproteobacteria bacterium]MBU2279019.1 S1/P1 nuclease [Gammaproteobacteria bacterium]MBU2426271.1 S1/P1 nuclease [Gammaproteobacteria bacterium]
MKKIIIGQWLLLVASFLLSTQAMAFSRTGHQQVCQAAYQLLSPKTQQQVDALLALEPKQSFADGCVWPDEARKEAAYRYTAPHHYINVARAARKVQQRDCAKVGCLLSAISHHGALLKSLPTSEAKRQSLLFFSHFVADLHQPMHVSYADDQGGNKTAVYFLQQPSNLHGVWDRNLLAALGYEQNNQLLSEKLTTISALQQRQWQQGSVLQWANESLKQTQKIYQNYRPGMLLDEAAISRDSPVIELRIEQAAVRLAHLLELYLAQDAS